MVQHFSKEISGTMQTGASGERVLAHQGGPGQWIWCAGEKQPRNFYLHLRRTFACRTGIRQAVLSLTADSRYHLFVNGVRVAFGPARSDRRWQCLDQWDITRYLRTGRNVIAALVHHYGEWTFSYMLGRGGFLADLALTYDDDTFEHLGSDASWLVRPAEAWDRRMPRMSIQLGFAEIFDARRDFEGWTSAEFDDAGWKPAVVLGPPGMEPWPRLVPRGIPAMTETPTHPVAVIDSGTADPPPVGHYVDLHRIVWCAAHGVAYLGTYIWSPKDLSLEIRAGSQEALKLWLNGENVISNFVKRDPSPDQERTPVQLRKGWNTVLAKVVQDEMQWHFLFRLHGEGSDRCVYSRTPTPVTPEADELDPWWLVGPLRAESMRAGFDTAYPPEVHWHPDAPVAQSGGPELRWISAGVTKESQITAILMSREQRSTAGRTRITNPQGLIGSGEPALFMPGDAHTVYAVIDFGKEVAGFPVLEIDGAAGGEIIDIGYSEFLTGSDGSVLSPAEGKMGMVNCDRGAVHYADRYICKPGRQQFRIFDKRAFRYMQVDVRGLTRPLRIGPASLLLSTYPVEYLGVFECSDSLLNKIWEVGRWTVQLNMEDAYTDCPWRERGQWWGDARIQALVNYYAFGDFALIRRGIRTVAQSQDADGWTRGIYPTDWSYAILPTFSLVWIISLYDYVRFSGDRTLATECLTQVRGVLEACGRYRAEHGLLRNMPYWLFVDWAGVDSTGESASVNALYYGALRATVELAQLVDRPEIGRTYAAIAEEVRTGMMQTLWDEEKRCFRESWQGGVTSKEVSEQANCWAIAFGMVEGERASEVMSAITHGGQATVRIGTPYFSFYMLDALSKSGNHAQMLEYIRKRWSVMLKWGATTWWEMWETNASHCHGWSAGPTCFLQSEVLGIKPALPGWEEITIDPHPGDLTWAKGSVPTPRGLVAVQWKNEERFSLRIDVPAKTRVRLPGDLCKEVEVRRVSDGAVCNFEQTKDAHGGISVIVPDPGSYLIHCT